MTMRLCALMLRLVVVMGLLARRAAAKSAPHRTFKPARPLSAPPSSSAASSSPSSASSSSSGAAASSSSGAASQLASSSSSSSAASNSSGIVSSSSSSSSSASISPLSGGGEFCHGYFDVMGLWDAPFSCSLRAYPLCCGTCSMRYCCNIYASQLDQSTCQNNRTPNWLPKPTPTVDPTSTYDPAMDRTNLVVYVVFGVIALALLSAVLAKVVLRRVTRAARDIKMPKALSGFLRHQPRRCRDEEFKGHPMHATPQSRDNSTTRSIKNHSEKPRVNNIHMTMALMTPLAPSESHQHLTLLPPSYTAAKTELARFNSLKRLADKELNEYYAKKHHLVEMASCGTLPLRVPHPDRQARGSDQQQLQQHWEQWEHPKQRSASAAAAVAAHVRTYGSTPALADIPLAPYATAEANGQADGYLGKQRLLEDFLHRDPRGFSTQPRHHHHHYHHYGTWRTGSEKGWKYHTDIYGSTPTLNKEPRQMTQRLPHYPTQDSLDRHHNTAGRRTPRDFPGTPSGARRGPPAGQARPDPRYGTASRSAAPQTPDGYGGSTPGLGRKRLSRRSLHRSDHHLLAGDSSEDYEYPPALPPQGPRRGYCHRRRSPDDRDGGATPPALPPRLPPRSVVSSGSSSAAGGNGATPDRAAGRARRGGERDDTATLPYTPRSTPAAHRLARRQSLGGGDAPGPPPPRQPTQAETLRTWNMASSTAKRQAFAGRRHLTLEQLNYAAAQQKQQQQQQWQTPPHAGTKSRNEVTV